MLWIFYTLSFLTVSDLRISPGVLSFLLQQTVVKLTPKMTLQFDKAELF